MQLDEAEALRKAWGDKPCKHPEVQKEYFLSSNTGDRVCSTCGAVVYDENDWAKYQNGTAPKLHNLD